MARLIDRIKEDLTGEVYSMTELENYMAEHKFHLVQVDNKEEDNTPEDIMRFTNYNSEIWIEHEIDEDGSVLISLVKSITRIDAEATRVDPFHSYEDLEKVQQWFLDNGMYHHWLVGWLMVAEGRRVGDTMKLKWSDFFTTKGKFRKRLIQLKEEKTGKVVAPVVNQIAKNALGEYIRVNDINVKKCYNENIFDCKPGAFRKALKAAVDHLELDYPVSTHSYRKFYGNTLYKLHPQDANNIKIIQFMFGHSDESTTKQYINAVDDQIDKYNEDYEKYIIAKMEGTAFEISNSPTITIKAEDLREALGIAWEMTNMGVEKFECVNKIIGMIEQCMV